MDAYNVLMFGPDCLSCKKKTRAYDYYVVFHQTEEADTRIICKKCLPKPENSFVYNYLLQHGKLEPGDIKDA